MIMRPMMMIMRATSEVEVVEVVIAVVVVEVVEVEVVEVEVVEVVIPGVKMMLSLPWRNWRLQHLLRRLRNNK